MPDARASIPAQGQVAAWARGERAGQRERADAGPSWPRWAKMKEEENFLIIFQEQF